MSSVLCIFLKKLKQHKRIQGILRVWVLSFLLCLKYALLLVLLKKLYRKSFLEIATRMRPIREMILPNNIGPIVKSPRIPPMMASPQAFRFRATMPPTRVKIERTAPMIPQVVRNDCSCSAEIGESAGSTV